MSKTINKCLSDFLQNDKEISEALKTKVLKKASQVKGEEGQVFRDAVFGTKNIDPNDIDLIKEAARLVLKEVVLQKSKTQKQVDAMIKNKNNVELAYNKILQQAKKLGKNIDEREARKEAYYSVFAHLNSGRASGNPSLEISRAVLEKELFTNIAYTLEKYGNLLNKFGDNFNQMFLRELRGIDTGNKYAKQVAEEFNSVRDVIRKKYADAGIYLQKNDEFYFFQQHSAEKMTRGKNAKNDWINYINKILDWDNMTYRDGRAIPKEERINFLNYAYESITTNGMNKRGEIELNEETGTFTKNKRQTLEETITAKRFLKFIDADSHHEYNKIYGETDYVGIMVEKTAEDAMNINLAKNLGPDPDKSFDYLKSLMANEKATYNSADLDKLDRLYSLVNNHALDQGNPTVSAIGSIMRRIGVIPNIGGIFLSTIPDLATHIANKMNGLKQIPNYAKLPVGAYYLMKHTIKSSYELFKSMGFSREHHARSLGIVDGFLWRQGRYVGIIDEMNSATLEFRKDDSLLKRAGKRTISSTDYLTKKITNSVYKFSLMNDFAQAQKKVITEELLNDFTEARRWDFNKIPQNMRDKMDAIGFTEKEFNALKYFETEKFEGNEMLTLNSMKNYDRTKLTEDEASEVFKKFFSFIEIQRRASYVETGNYVKGMSQMGQNKVGSVGYQVAKVITQFKSFPLTFFFEKMRPMFVSQTKAQGFYDFAMYSMLVLPTGYLSLQLKQLSNGYTMVDPTKDEKTFWETAIRSWTGGGGLSFGSDLIFNDFTGTRDALSYAAGPTGEMLSNSVGFVSRVLNTLFVEGGLKEEKGTNTLNDGNNSYVIDFLNKADPYSSIWFMKPVKKLMIDHHLNEMFNDNYAKQQRELDKRLRKKGQENYIKDLYDEM
jgi:hypothetical protein